MSDETKTKTGINVKLLRKIQRIILKEPRKFDMELLHAERRLSGGLEYCECGTVHCIAGWALKLTGMKSDISLAVGALRLEWGQAHRLFRDFRWPDSFRAEYRAAKSHAARAKVAARRIDHFIKTGGKE